MNESNNPERHGAARTKVLVDIAANVLVLIVLAGLVGGVAAVVVRALASIWRWAL